MILIVFRTNNWAVLNRYTEPLRVLGIPYALAYTGTGLSDNLQTPAGSFAPASSDLRNYFKQFRAVWVIETEALQFNGLRSAHHWLGWNNADDTPIVYFGWNFAQERSVPLPSDFPIVAPSTADISSALSVPQQPDTAVVLDNYAALHHATAHRFGSVVSLSREQVEAHIPTWCWYENSTWRVGVWRLDTTKHAALGGSGEVLATLAAQPDETYPSNNLVAYRYKNRYFLPMLRGTAELHRQERPDLFWELYALKLLGIQPLRKLPVYWETDHPIQLTDGGSPAMPNATMLTIQRDTWAWLRDFCRQTGMVCHNGVLTGGMSRQRFSGAGMHWNLVHGTQYGHSTEVEQLARQAHEILLVGHKEGALPCGCHDHTTDPTTRGFWGVDAYPSFKRHSSSYYAESVYNPGGLSFPLQAPNNVLKKRGRCCVAKHALPQGAAGADATQQQMGEADYSEWDYESDAYTGAGTDLGSLPAGSLHAARLVIESNVAELLALGFPDGYGGGYGYTNTAANHAGGDYYWQAAREYGYKALRSTYHCNIGGSTKNKATPPNMIWHGFHLIASWDMEWIVTGSRGLFAPGNSANAVAVWGLQHNNDVATGWPDTAYRAHRRAMNYMTARWLAASVALVAPYIHPVTYWAGASPSNPTARFAGANVLNWFGHPAWNPQVELLENMRVIVGVLSDYLKFGSVSDVIAVRERVLE